MATKNPAKRKRKRFANDVEVDFTSQLPTKRRKLNRKNKKKWKSNTKNNERSDSEILSFEYESDFDENGFIFYLGTDNKRYSIFENPTDDGLISTSSSPLLPNSKSSDYIIDRTPQHCITKARAQPWFIIDFTLSQYEILPKQYTLRHIKSSHNALRNWYFEGSNDAISWYILKEHHNDTALDTKCKSFTWNISTNEYFAMFRVKQFGKNSSNKYNLACSGFEIYGNVRKTEKKKFAIDETITSDSDSEIEILTEKIKPSTVNNKMAMDTNHNHNNNNNNNHNSNHNNTNNNFEISAEEKLCDMGFDVFLVKESLKYVDNNINCMMDWLYSHETTEEESLNLKIIKICQIIECQRHEALYALKESDNDTKNAIDLLVKAHLNTSFIVVNPTNPDQEEKEKEEEENEINNLSPQQISTLQLEDNILCAKLESISDFRKKEQEFKKMKPFISSELRSMGFLQIAVQNALNNKCVSDKKGAIQYILTHPLNDIQEKNAKIAEIKNSGYTFDDATQALNKYSQNLNMAMEWLIQGKPFKIKHFLYHIACKNVMAIVDNCAQLSENVNFKNMNQQWSFFENGKIKNFSNNKILTVSCKENNKNDYDLCVICDENIDDDDIKNEEDVFRYWEIDFDEKTIKNKECDLYLVFRNDLNRFCLEKTLHIGDMEQRWCFIDENELTKINPKELHQLLDSQDFECIVCLDREPNARLQPCGHSTFCQTCVGELTNKKCPICRTEICSIQKFELS